MGPYILWALLLLGGVAADMEEAQDLINELDETIRQANSKIIEASWNYENNLTDENAHKKTEITLEQTKLIRGAKREAFEFPWTNLQNETLRRMFKFSSFLGPEVLGGEDQTQMLSVIEQMIKTVSTATICDFFDKSKCDLDLEPEITKIMAESRDTEQLKYTWKEWFKVAGKPSKSLFTEYVQLMNKAAKLNNLTTADEIWLYPYEDSSFKEKCRALLEQLEPLYKELHAYVRYRLRLFYGEDVVSRMGPIPEYLLGNLWGQTWENIYEIVAPFPNASTINITEELVKQSYSPLKMFRVAEEFFTSLNLSQMNPKFWEKSVLEKPTDRQIVCHPSAWDLVTRDDFRIKMCTSVNDIHFYVIHHEMGHTQYQMLYSHLPFVFQNSANPGFHEAVGDTIGLSVITPKHLKKVGLYNGDINLSKEARINQQLGMALKKIAFIPFGYLIDLWRWDVFSGSVKPDQYNCKFWEMKLQYQGVAPPEPRSKEYFDPAGKFHVSANEPYVRYLVSHILQFQFLKALCEKAGEYSPGDPEKPLNSCDIYQSTEAGNAFKSMLELGSSKPWPDALEQLTGSREMDAGPLLEYFQELYEWLKEENKKNGEYVGWKIPQKMTCYPPTGRKACKLNGRLRTHKKKKLFYA